MFRSPTHRLSRALAAAALALSLVACQGAGSPATGSVRLALSGTSPDGRLVEFVELPRAVHPYYVGTQAHPEFRSRPARAHPLFIGLIKAAIDTRTVALPDAVSTP